VKQRAHKVDEWGLESSMTTYRDQLFSISKSPHAKLRRGGGCSTVVCWEVEEA